MRENTDTKNLCIWTLFTQWDQYRKDTYSDHEDAYNYYDIDADKISLFKQINNEYFIRYIDLSKAEIVPLQLKIKNFCGRLHTFTNNDTVLFIENDNKELFKKLKEIWNKIIKIRDIDNASDFVKTDLDDDSEFIEVDVLESIYDDHLAIFYILFLMIIFKHYHFNAGINHIIKHTIKIYNHSMYAIIIIKNFYFFSLKL